ncbi:MAG: ABC transporter permease [Streptosporangiaceae bacterium]
MRTETASPAPAASGRPSARVVSASGRLRAWGQTWGSVLGVLVLFEILSRVDVLPSRYFPPVSQMFAVLGQELATVGFWAAVANTMQGWSIGLGIAVAFGVPVGMVVGSSRTLYRFVRPLIEFLRPIPSVALIPLAILIYGTGLQSKVFLVVFASFWPLLVQSLYGVQDVDPVATDTARVYGLGRLERMVRVQLPGAVPYIATGLRLSSAVALILAVTAELVIGSPGLGQAINTARSGGAIPLMYALIIATGLIGWGLNIVFTRVERRVLHWHPSHREA